MKLTLKDKNQNPLKTIQFQDAKNLASWLKTPSSEQDLEFPPEAVSYTIEGVDYYQDPSREKVILHVQGVVLELSLVGGEYSLLIKRGKKLLHVSQGDEMVITHNPVLSAWEFPFKMGKIPVPVLKLGS